MPLEHAILVSLAEQSASGYELARRFDRSIGFFWHATHQQIYKVLARMETGGTVTAEAVAQHGRPDKKVYSVTATGREELEHWSRKTTPVDRLRSEFAVKVRGMPFGDREAVLGDIERQRAAHIETLEHYRDSEARHYPNPEKLEDSRLPGYLVLRGGIRYESGQIAWCDEMLDALDINGRG